MAWTSPRTWVGGELVDDTLLNTHLRDNQNHLKTALDSNGKITALTSTYLESVDGTGLTGVAKTASNNSFTAGTTDFDNGSGTRLILPVGSNKWAT